MRQHTTDRTCWCEPRLEEQPDGRMLVTHDDATWTGLWGTYLQENGDVVVRPADEGEGPEAALAGHIPETVWQSFTLRKLFK